MLEDISDLSGHKTPHGKVWQVIPAEAVEAAAKVLWALLESAQVEHFQEDFVLVPHIADEDAL